MAFYSLNELKNFGFKSLGKNVKISTSASIYDTEKISIGDHSRIDDFCILSGNITIGRNVHITPNCLVAGGEKGIVFEDFTTIAYQVKVFTQSDDYSGETMTNSTVPKQYKNETMRSITIGKYSIVGAGSTIMPGAHLAEGTSVGAMSLVLSPTEPWSVYVGIPARKMKDRKKDLLKLLKQYLQSEDN